MKTTAARDQLIEALRNLPSRMTEKLELLKRIGLELSKRPDLVWHMLLQSMSGMGNNRGYARLILNENNYRKVAWATLEAMPESKRFVRLRLALAAATVRMPEQKAEWLMDNFKKIQQMGGIDAALEQMRNLRGRAQKLAFFRQFMGIGEKYARNIWMDLCDPDFRDAIAIDVRLQKIYVLLGISTADYGQAEQIMLNIAGEAGLTGWEVDRLLFHFSDYFLAADSHLSAGEKENGRDEEKCNSEQDESNMSNSGQQVTSESCGTLSVALRWETLYESFLKRRNTSSWGKKAEYARAILREFGGRVPLAIIVDDVQRQALCENLFKSSNDFNFIIYSLGMGVYLGALGRDGEHLVVVRPELV